MTRHQAVTFLRRVSLVGVYGGLLMPLVFLPVVIFPFVFSKLIFFQVLIGLTFPAFLILMWMEPRYRPKSHILYFSLAAYFIALILSTIFSVDVMRSWWGNQERMNGLFTLLHFFVWLTMTVGMVKTWVDWRRLLNYEVVLSAIMALVALLQKVYPKLLLFPAGPRVGGLLDNPIYMGVYQIFNLFFLGLLFWKTPSKQARIWYVVLAVLDIAAFFAAQSRGELVGLAAGLLAFAVFIGVFSRNKRARYATLALVATLFVAYGTLFALRDTTLVKDTVFYRLTHFSSSVSTRFIAWEIAWDGFLERPITGWGLDAFHILFNQKYNPRSLGFGSYETWFDRSHNTVLDILSMTGVVGFITFASIVVTLFVSLFTALRKKRIDLPIGAILFGLAVAYFVQNLFVFDHPAAFSMSFLLYAFVIAATQSGFLSSEQKIEESKSLHPFRWTPFVILQLLALLLVWRASLLPFQASRMIIKSNSIFNSPAGLRYAQAAFNIWTPYLDEQSFLVSRNLITMMGQTDPSRFPQWKDYYELAKRLTQEELRRHPLNTHPHYVYAQLSAAMMGVDPQAKTVSEEQFKEAIKTSPKRQELYFRLADLYLRTGRVDEALVVNKQAVDFDPEIGDSHWNYGLALMYHKQDQKNGAKELLASQTVLYPFELQDIRQMLALMDAATILNDRAMLAKLVNLVNETPAGRTTNYLQIASKYRQLGMPEQEEVVIDFVSKIDPSAPTQYQQMQQTGQVVKVNKDGTVGN